MQIVPGYLYSYAELRQAIQSLKLNSCFSKFLHATCSKVLEINTLFQPFESNDGVRDSNEGTIANVTIQLFDENGELAQQYGIRGIPTMIFFKDGQAAKTLVGLQPKEEIKKS